MNEKSFALVVGVLFAVVAAAQGARLVLRLEISLNGQAIPLWPSAVACLVLGLLALWAFRIVLAKKNPE